MQFDLQLVFHQELDCWGPKADAIRYSSLGTLV
jgi:hypothetical protein